MVNKNFSILLVVPVFVSIMLFSSFMTPVSAGMDGGPDFTGGPISSFDLDIDLGLAPQTASPQGELEIKENFMAPVQPGWENHNHLSAIPYRWK